AGHPEQLLELLRALWQRVEVPGLQPCGHHEIACSFRRASDEERSLDLDEVVAFQLASDGGGQASAQEHPLAHGWATEVEIPILEPKGFFQPRLLLVDVEGRHLRLV